MIESSIANAADYADALLSARKAKNILILLVLAMLLFQLAHVLRRGTKLNWVLPDLPLRSLQPLR